MLKKCVVPQARMKTAKHQNTQLKIMSGRRETKKARASGIEK